jgi:hypothetical protein
MPRYYFDIHDAEGFHRDDIGDDFVDFEEARDQAQALLPDIVREELPDGELHEVACEVRDQSGRTVYRGEITFRGTRL